MSTEKFTDVSKKLVRQAEEMSRMLRDANKGMAAAMERAEQLANAGSFEDAYKLLRGAVNTSYMAPSEAPVVERVVQAQPASQPSLAERVQNGLKDADFPPNFFAGVFTQPAAVGEQKESFVETVEPVTEAEADFIPVENEAAPEETSVSVAQQEEAPAEVQEASTAFAPKPVDHEEGPADAAETAETAATPAEEPEAKEEAPAIASAPAPGAMFG